MSGADHSLSVKEDAVLVWEEDGTIYLKSSPSDLGAVALTATQARQVADALLSLAETQGD
jgi:hypothetical protein